MRQGPPERRFSLVAALERWFKATNKKTSSSGEGVFSRI
jgi:hypothetical protein